MKTLLFVFTFSTFSLFSQLLNITNQFAIGGSGDDDLTYIKSPANDGYFFIGSSNSNISGDKTQDSRGGFDIWVVKTDLQFNILWDKTFGGNNDDIANSFQIVSDKIYIISTSTSDISGEKTIANFGESDIWTICLDLNGNLLWQNQYGGSQFENRSKLIEFSDTSFALVTSSDSPISGNKTENTKGMIDNWLIEISKINGQIIKQKVVGSSNNDSYPIIKQSNSGNIYLACSSASGISGDKTDAGFGTGAEDIWMIELDADFNILNNKCFGGDGIEDFPNLLVSNDAVYLTASSGSFPSGNKTAELYFSTLTYFDLWLVKLDQNFNIIWDKSYGGTSEESGSTISSLTSGEIVLMSNSNSLPGTGNKTAPKYGNYDSWLLIVDTNGSILTQETYGGSEYEFADVFQLSSSELLYVAATNSPISGNKSIASKGGYDCWVVKIGSLEVLGTSEIISKPLISFYPNPFSNLVTFNFNSLNENSSLLIYDLNGQLLEKINIQPNVNSYEWVKKDDSNVYLFEFITPSISYKGKLISF